MLFLPLIKLTEVVDISFLCPPAVQQLELLEGRKKQYMKAALQAKQNNNIEQAKIFLRSAKGLDPMIEAARSGSTVDISTVSRQIYSP